MLQAFHRNKQARNYLLYKHPLSKPKQISQKTCRYQNCGDEFKIAADTDFKESLCNPSQPSFDWNQHKLK